MDECEFPCGPDIPARPGAGQPALARTQSSLSHEVRFARYQPLKCNRAFDICQSKSPMAVMPLIHKHLYGTWHALGVPIYRQPAENSLHYRHLQMAHGLPPASQTFDSPSTLIIPTFLPHFQPGRRARLIPNPRYPECIPVSFRVLEPWFLSNSFDTRRGGRGTRAGARSCLPAGFTPQEF